MTSSRLTPAVEDYLEAILQLENDHLTVRSTDLAARLGVSRAAVSKAMAGLAEAGLIDHGHYGKLRLTDTGRTHAARILHSHRLLKRFLVEVLHIGEATAEADACRLEHLISEETREKWLQYIERTLKSPSTHSTGS